MKLFSHTRAACLSMARVTIISCLLITAVSAFTTFDQRNAVTQPRKSFPFARNAVIDETMDSGDLSSKAVKMDSPVQEYRNLATKVLSNFMRKEKMEETSDPLGMINFNEPKISKLPLETLAQLLDAELYELEWFVTGKVNPSYFADEFKFQDPDVKVSGIEQYARGVNKLFDQKTARAEIISTLVNREKADTITCTWRLSGGVAIGPGLTIKPYIVYTDFTVDPQNGLIVFQQDRFAVPQWDILVSSFFPWTIGKITAPPAPPVEPRVVLKPKLAPTTSSQTPLNAFMSIFSNLLQS